MMNELHSKSSKRCRMQTPHTFTKLPASTEICERGGRRTGGDEDGTGENVSGRRFVLVVLEKVRNSCQQDANSNPCVNSGDQSVGIEAWACGNPAKRAMKIHLGTVPESQGWLPASRSPELLQAPISTGVKQDSLIRGLAMLGKADRTDKPKPYGGNQTSG